METSNASEEFILHFPVEMLGASKSPDEYDVLCELEVKLTEYIASEYV